MFLHSLLLQNMAKNTPQETEVRSKDGRPRGMSKKSPWYQRAVELLLLIWKQPATGAATTTKAAAAAGVSSSSGTNGKAGGKLRKSSSLNVAASFTRVCLCAPISSYNEQSLYFQAGDAAAPRRSYSYPRASSASASASGCSNNSPLVAPPPRAEPVPQREMASARQRPVFRGKSLTDDILMRRFVVDEGATRRRNEMDVIRRRHAAAAKRRRLGPSPLRRMALPEELPESEAEEEEVPESTRPKRKGNGQSSLSSSSAVALLA